MNAQEHLQGQFPNDIVAPSFSDPTLFRIDLTGITPYAARMAADALADGHTYIRDPSGIYNRVWTWVVANALAEQPGEAT